MKSFNNIDEVLDFAMQAEQDAVDFYTLLAGTAGNDDMRQVFESFAQEEMKHKARLSEIKERGILQLRNEQVTDLKIADYTVDVQPTATMTYAEALVLAMKREKAAFRLYLNLSENADHPEMKEIFLSLAQEESRHKLRFELEYDEFVLREN